MRNTNPKHGSWKIQGSILYSYSYSAAGGTRTRTRWDRMGSYGIVWDRMGIVWESHQIPRLRVGLVLVGLLCRGFLRNPSALAYASGF